MYYGGAFDYEAKDMRLQEVVRELELPETWNHQEKLQALNREKVQLEHIVLHIHNLTQNLEDIQALYTLAQEEQDEALIHSIYEDVVRIEKEVHALEFQRMFSHPMDKSNAYLDIQSGSGGTEAQDWAAMLMRMYLRFAEHHGFQTEVVDMSQGEVAGIKGASIYVTGPYAYGWLRTETGVHRLVRKSPFDSGHRRHTSFASVFVSPEVDDDIDIVISPADLRIDTYRASGAGGQHVNRTDSAVRITHIPTGTVVQCQTDRSQHRNKDQAMQRLRARLYELELQKKTQSQSLVEESKADIGWGSQIRSYVLDQSRVKDLRTQVETSNTQAVLDGDLDAFIEASLKMGTENE